MFFRKWFCCNGLLSLPASLFVSLSSSKTPIPSRWHHFTITTDASLLNINGYNRLEIALAKELRNFGLVLSLDAVDLSNEFCKLQNAYSSFYRTFVICALFTLCCLRTVLRRVKQISAKVRYNKKNTCINAYGGIRHMHIRHILEVFHAVVRLASWSKFIFSLLLSKA